MGTTPEDGENNVEAVTLEELARLEEGELSAAEEEQLQMRIAEDPAAQELLDRVRRVDSYFPPPLPSAPTPTDMPEDMAERLRARARREAERAASGAAPPSGPWDSDEDFDPEDP